MKCRKVDRMLEKSLLCGLVKLCASELLHQHLESGDEAISDNYISWNCIKLHLTGYHVMLFRQPTLTSARYLLMRGMY